MMEQSWVPVIAAGPDQVGPAGPAGPQGPAGGPPGPQGDPAKAYVGDSPPPPESSFVLWVDTSDESAVPGSPSLTIKGIGNLLTLDQANVVGGGWHGLAGTYDTTTDGGITVGRFTVTGANGNRDAFNLLTPMPFDAGVTRTATISIKPSATRTVRFMADGWDAGWTNRDYLGVCDVSCPAGVWTDITHTVTTTAARPYVGVVATVLSAQTGDVILAKRASVHNGAGGKWQRPGVPVTGQSHIATNGAFVTSGTVAPEGNITAPPLSRYMQTSGAATATGAMEWVKATGTGSTGWVAGADADTGLRNVSAALVAGANVTLSYTFLQRTGNRVDVSFRAMYSGGAVGANPVALFELPPGFRPVTVGIRDFVIADGGATPASVRQGFLRSYVFQVYNPTPNTEYNGMFTIATPDAWPTSLLGTPA